MDETLEPFLCFLIMRKLAVSSILGVLVLLLSARATAQGLYDETIVRDFKLTFHQANYWTLLDQNRATEDYIEADMEVDGVVYLNVGVRFKGNSSASVWPEEKMPFKIKMDQYVLGQELLGFDTINLGNAFMDPTFCREVVTYNVLRQYMPAPRANFVRLWINDEYWGIYNNTEQVSGEMLSDWFDDNDGNRYKCDPVTSGGPGGGNMATLLWLGSNPTSYYDIYELKSDPNGTEWLDLIDLCDVLNNGTIANIISDVDDNLRIDRALWFLAGMNLFVNRDSYIESGHNYYVFNDLAEGRFSTIPWDVNEAFGNFGMGMSVTQLQRMSPIENYGDSDYPLITRLLNTNSGPRGRAAYYANYREMLERSWNWTVIGGLVTQYQDLIEPDVIADTKKLYTLQQFYNNVTQDVTIGGGGGGGGGGGRTSCGLQPFVNNRQSYLQGLAALNGIRPEYSDVAVLPSNPTDQDLVAVTARIEAPGSSVEGAVLMWRAGKVGPYNEATMYDDGNHGDGAANDGVWAGLIPPQPEGTKVRYYMLAWTPSDNATHFPWQAEEAPSSYKVEPLIDSNGIVINEFLADNDTGATDEAGENDDWVEILNTTAATVDISGWYLSDDLQLPTQWAFPTGTTLAPGQAIVVWCDNDLAQGPLHANFQLDKNGEEVSLVDSDGTTVRDFYDFSDQAPDVSTGRLFDGGTPWVSLHTPTAGASNGQSCGYRSFDQVDPFAHGLLLEGFGSPAVGGSADVKVSGATQGDAINLYVSREADYLSGLTEAGVALVSLSKLVMQSGLTANAFGEATVTVPINNPALVGFTFYAQAHMPTSSLGEQLSNALEIIICP